MESVKDTDVKYNKKTMQIDEIINDLFCRISQFYVLAVCFEAGACVLV